MRFRNECDGKVNYGTWSKAQRDAHTTNITNRERNEQKRVHVYRCPTCHGIHIGKAWNRRGERP